MSLLEDPRPPVFADGVLPGNERHRIGRRLWGALQRWESAVSDRLLVSFLVVVALALRVPRLGIRYWGDEAIAISIAGRPVREIPGYLTFDGSPPLWYLLLHWWMHAFGHSEVATHSFSLLLSVAAIPVAWWCGGVLFNRRAGRAGALLCAVSPYLAYYGTETRMYALLGLLSMVAVTAFVRSYQERPLRGRWRAGGWRTDPSKRWLLLAIVSSEAVLYTHNWGLFLVPTMVVVGLLAAWRRGDALCARRVACFAAAVLVGYLPWLPEFVTQLRSTGAPWAPHPQLADLIVDPFNVAFSAGAFVMVAGIGLTIVAKGRVERWHLRSPRRLGAEWTLTSPLGLMTVIVVGTLLVGWTACQFVQAWAARYLGVAVVPALVVLGGLFAEHRVGRRCLVVVAVALAVTSMPVVLDPGAFAYSKSNVAAVDGAVRSRMVPGDLVVTALAELPIIAYYLPPGLRYATPLGLVKDPSVVDWQNLPTRLRAAVPTSALATVLTSVPVGGHVLVINPLSFGNEAPTQYGQTVAAEGVAINQDIILDPDFRSVLFDKPHHPGAIANPVEGILYVRTALPSGP